MKIKGLLVASMMMLTATTTLAESTNTSSSAFSDIWKKLKDSPFSMSYLNDTYASAKLMQDKGLKSGHYLYLNYKLDKYHKFTIKPLVHTDWTKKQKDDNQVHTELHSTELRFTRSSILNQNDHGVNYSFLLRNYVMNNAKESGYDTYHLLYNSFSRSFGKYNLSFAPGLYIYNKNKGANNVQDTINYVGLTHTYSVNDNIYLSFANAYYGYKYDDKSNNRELLLTNLTAGYTFSNGVDVSLYFEGYTFDSAIDNNLIASYQPEWVKNSYVGTLVSFPIF
ncbi:hypothetical protein HBN50_06450 [Halobacteriovorax sp. GB3]|uniref:hypothetical protein n=1 Tax=Halobacteriovorax sp. GB3 TaxID=2719615 RepID=UPI00235FB26A|nr:hypothetical protein [Halobacteriovorax sp. GB3]MDD0852728.1 hypothetical protein [Halobacteriovorax sp. GB3]